MLTRVLPLSAALGLATLMLGCGAAQIIDDDTAPDGDPGEAGEDDVGEVVDGDITGDDPAVTPGDVDPGDEPDPIDEEPTDEEPIDTPEPVWVAEPQGGTTVTIEGGVIEGEKDGNLRIFRGIPYAEPPIGEHRFAPPRKVAPWEGTFPATHFGAVCPQTDLGDFALGDVDISEDCLSVNVWAHDDGQQRPVMVFIYGGAFILGATSQPLYDGAELARRGDVTVVSLNYRLGALGWLASADLAAADGNPTAGNWGLMDQIEALRWVKANIATFGGDPDNVTIFGESAGAISVCALLGTPDADPLFEKAIIQSGMCALGTYDEGGLIGMPSASQLAEAFVAEVGCDEAFNVADCLRAKPWDELVDATSLTSVITGDLEAISAITPIVDGDLLPMQPIDRLRSGEVDKPIIVGSTRDEGKLFTSTDVVLTRGALRGKMEDFFAEGPVVDELMNVYSADDFFFPKDAWTALMGEATFICPGIEVAKAAATGAPAYTYHFTHTPLAAAAIGPTHGMELPFVFGTFGSLALLPTGTDLELSDSMQGAWSSFARYGTPSLPSGWSPWLPDAPSVVLLNGEPSEVESIRNDRCEALKALGVVY
jgi:para-nitrobenzyl esterase